MAAAKKHFETEREKRKAMRDVVAAGPGAGMEQGSAEAVKFLADQTNARMAAIAIPEQRKPTQTEILEEIRRQFAETQKQTALAAKQEKILLNILTVVDQNGFRRLP
jgi:hypothetical protein